MGKTLNFKAALLGGVLFVATMNAAQAADLLDDVTALLASHERIRAAEADLAAAAANEDVARGGYYPTVSATVNYGNETIATHAQQTNGAAQTHTTTSYQFNETDLSVSQLLYDFGSTDAQVDSAGLTVSQSRATLEQTRQAILLEALSAQFNLASAKRVLDYQQKSEDSIKRQTELENARVERGSGFSTDVLQAKTQLAGAQAARVRADGALKKSLNRYRAVFGKLPDDMSGLELPKLANVALPGSEEDLVDTALDQNPQVVVAAIAAQIADQAVKQSFADGYRPVVNAVAEQKWKDSVAGTKGQKNETVMKVEASFDFNMGWTAANTLKASKSGHSAATSRLKDTRDQIEEQARNAWQALETTKANAEFLKNQANIASEFLELARKERKLGQRSLIDVLSGETSLINAQAAADRAETDVAIAVLTVLNVMGKLDTSVLQ
ncbi:MAG: TolC family protein [Alphaproteobacteria bacterium]|nr:TolC family protein [Alphaproteobacteria bacterium]